MIKFYFKETIKLISGSKSFFLLSLVSMLISLMLISLFLITMDFSSSIQKKIKNEFALNVFINDSLNEEGVNALSNEFHSKNYVREVTFIDKNKAAEIFSSETGENLNQVLDFNPLPESFVLKFRDEYVQPDSLNKIIPNISKLQGVDEIVHKQEHLKNIVDFLNVIKKYLLGTASVLFLLTISIVYSTSRLLIISRKDEIEAMKLVGAKVSSIKLPVLIYSGLIGLISGIISLFFSNLYLSELYRYINISENNNLINLTNILTFLSIGPAIAILVSYITMRKITLKF